MANYETESIALSFLTDGNTKERHKAIASLSYCKKPENYFDELFRVFLSDENRDVRVHCLNACIHIKPIKILELLEYCYQEQLRVRETYFIEKKGNNYLYNDSSKDPEILFLDSCILKLGKELGQKRDTFEKLFRSK